MSSVELLAGWCCGKLKNGDWEECLLVENFSIDDPCNVPIQWLSVTAPLSGIRGWNNVHQCSMILF